MDAKFKQQLIENLESAKMSLDVVLNQKGSIGDICEVDGPLLETMTELSNQIENYVSYLVRQDAIDELNANAPAKIRARPILPSRVRRSS